MLFNYAAVITFRVVSTFTFPSPTIFLHRSLRLRGEKDFFKGNVGSSFSITTNKFSVISPLLVLSSLERGKSTTLFPFFYP